VRVVDIPMRVTFRSVNRRQSALIQGPAGWGEFAPFLEYDDHEAAAWLACALESAWLGAPPVRRTTIPVNATLPAVSAEQVPEVLNNYRGTIHELKIKVAEKGQTLDDDIARVAAARRALPNARLKVDANAGWSVPEALEALAALNEYDLLYAEQPVATVDELAQVRALVREHGLSMLIAADESVRKASDPLKVAQAHAADVLIVKAAPLGGARRALKIVEQAGLPAVVSSALESSVGIATGVSLAAALPNLPYACGLSTVSLMSADVTENSLLARDGELEVRRVTPTESALRCVEAEGEVRDAWMERIRRCYLVLQEALPTSL
ncbi:O-succinylbenzoate synthase, partial [Rothia dentocariosa]|uniref:o-succinylbenzoate synthase n=1 Tax=Rothia dentocariosa TaxID=2047 RepID=UPI001072E7A4